MLTGNGFERLIADDQDHERVFSEIYFDGKFVALVSRCADDRFVVELPGPDCLESRIVREVELDGFLKALKEAREDLL